MNNSSNTLLDCIGSIEDRLSTIYLNENNRGGYSSEIEKITTEELKEYEMKAKNFHQGGGVTTFLKDEVWGAQNFRAC